LTIGSVASLFLVCSQILIQKIWYEIQIFGASLDPEAALISIVGALIG